MSTRSHRDLRRPRRRLRRLAPAPDPPVRPLLRHGGRGGRARHAAPQRVLDLGAGTGLLSARSPLPTRPPSCTCSTPRPQCSSRGASARRPRDDPRRRLRRPAARPVRSTRSSRRWPSTTSTTPASATCSPASTTSCAPAACSSTPSRCSARRRRSMPSTPPGTSGRASPSARPSEEWDASMQRRAFDRCATVADQLTWLADAGFTDVDCRFQDHLFAVLVAGAPRNRETAGALTSAGTPGPGASRARRRSAR